MLYSTDPKLKSLHDTFERSLNEVRRARQVYRRVQQLAVLEPFTAKTAEAWADLIAATLAYDAARHAFQNYTQQNSDPYYD